LRIADLPKERTHQLALTDRQHEHETEDAWRAQKSDAYRAGILALHAAMEGLHTYRLHVGRRFEQSPTLDASEIEDTERLRHGTLSALGPISVLASDDVVAAYWAADQALGRLRRSLSPRPGELVPYTVENYWTTTQLATDVATNALEQFAQAARRDLRTTSPGEGAPRACP
jgi:hypothetical protein